MGGGGLGTKVSAASPSQEDDCVAREGKCGIKEWKGTSAWQPHGQRAQERFPAVAHWEIPEIEKQLTEGLEEAL